MRSWKILLSGFFCVLVSSLVEAQTFGRNKPNYDTYDFKVKESKHFALYQYLNNDSLANALVEESEGWYRIHQQIFRDTFPDKNPIVVYKNHPDFQQSTVISGSIGVGTGGVTEGLKNRVIIPVMELNEQTNHVLGHELVHVFQYRMFKNSQDSLSMEDINNVPLWMVEGLAEYLSIGSHDSHTAMWMRDAVANDNIPTLKDLTRKPNEYFPYRYGHAFWSFVTGVYGDSIVYPLFRRTAKLGLEDAIKEVTGLSQDEFSTAWRNRLIAYYSPFISHSDKEARGTTLLSKSNSGEINIAPSVSPNGQYFAFLSERNFFSIDLFLADAKTGKVIKELSSTARNSHIDEFSFIESAGTWSPHSNQFAFTVYKKGQTMLSIVDVGGQGETKTVPIPGVPYFSNPSWSPNGEVIVVSGIVDGQSDLFAYNLKTKEVKQITNDRYSDYQPQWSPDGSALVFISDRPSRSQSYDMHSLQLCLIKPSDPSPVVVGVFPDSQNLNPVFAPDGNSIYFLSDRDGKRNLYELDLKDDGLYQLTDFATGISGITPYAPAISVSSATGEVYYTFYYAGDYTINKARTDELLHINVNQYDVDKAAGILPPARRASDLVNRNVSRFSRPEDVAVKNVPYKPRFGLEYIGNNVGIGISSGAFGTNTGLAGGVNAIFGDILGRHKLYTSLALNGEIYDLGGQIAYLNQKYRVNFGASVSHVPYRYSSVSLSLDTLQLDEEHQLPVVNYMLDVFRIFEDNVTVFGYWPLSQTRRFELGAGYSFYSFRADRIHNYYSSNGIKVGEKRERLEAPDGYQLGNVYGAYVHDNSYFGLASPMRGKRYRFEAGRTYNRVDYNTISLDYRQYKFLNPTSFAFRLMHFGRYGADAESELVNPLSFAYPTLTRGNSFSDISSYQVQSGEQYSINNIFGSRIMVGNIEWRLPFTGPKRLALIKSRIFFSEIALFADGGVAWTSNTKPVLKFTPESPDERVPFLSGGVSLRVNLFGQIVFEPFYAFPWRSDHFEKGVFGLNLSPGW